MKKLFLILMVAAIKPCFAQTNATCLDVPLSLTGDTKEVTVDKSPLNTTTEKTYVYYRCRKHRKNDMPQQFADLTDPRASMPVLVGCAKSTQAITQTYKVTVSAPDDQIRVCPDSSVSLSPNINVEKESDYTGYYPATTKNSYKEVSKRVYKKTARKMHNAKRKEERMARLTGLKVETSM